MHEQKCTLLDARLTLQHLSWPLAVTRTRANEPWCSGAISCPVWGSRQALCAARGTGGLRSLVAWVGSPLVFARAQGFQTVPSNTNCIVSYPRITPLIWVGPTGYLAESARACMLGTVSQCVWTQALLFPLVHFHWLWCTSLPRGGCGWLAESLGSPAAGFKGSV